MRSFLIPAGVLASWLSGIAEAAEPTPVPASAEIILVPHEGSEPIDRKIIDLQSRIKNTPSRRDPLVERLGWSFVAKARLSHDPGFYKLAEQCAHVLRDTPEASLLRGHVAHALHRFRDAEEIGRQLVKVSPDRWQVHALLGDALLDQGQLDGAVEAYQRMIDLKPCAETYSRVAQVRWLKGDLEGAIELMRQSVEAGSPRDPEPMAWAYTRLAAFQLQAGDAKGGAWSADRALQLVPDYAPALLARGKMLLAQEKPAEAAVAIESAAKANPLPEYQWALADALRAAGQVPAAEKTEALLARRGAVEDPRTLSLFLATRGKEAQRALELAQAEIKERRDIFTLDALAWASLAAGQLDEARTHMAAALVEGTQDARLFLHAGAIAAAAGERPQATSFFTKAKALGQMLLPSERERLARESQLFTAKWETAPDSTRGTAPPQ